MHQDQPAVAAPRRRHQRRAVGQPRPAPFGQLQGRLRQYLAAHRHLVRHLQAVERAVAAKRRQALWLAPAHGAAERPAPAAQGHRGQVVGGLGQVGSGEAQHGAAGLEPSGHRLALGGVGQVVVGQHQHRNFALDQLGDTAAADLAERVQRPVEVMQFVQQRLHAVERAGGDQTHRTAPPAVVDEHDRAGGALALDGEPREVVAKLRRQHQPGARVGLAGGKDQRLVGQHAAVDGNRAQPVFGAFLGRRRPGRAQRRDGQVVALVFRRPQQDRQPLRRVGDELQGAQTLQPLGQRHERGPLLQVLVVEAVAQPHDVDRGREIQLLEGGQRRPAVGGPRLRNQCQGQRPQLGRGRHVARRHRPAVGGRRRR